MSFAAQFGPGATQKVSSFTPDGALPNGGTAVAQQPKGNFWASQLPSGLAAAASFIPGVGTLGAAGLGAAGELARQNIAGENVNYGKVALEAGLSAIPFGLGKAAKVVKGGVEAAKAVNVTRKGLKAVESAAPVVQEASQAVPAVTEAAPNLFSKMSTGLEASARGIKPGATATGQEQLGAQGADELNQFLNDVGVRGKNASGQLSKLEQLHAGWGKQLGTIIDEGNKPLPATSISAVKDSIEAHLSQIAGLSKTPGETALVGPDGQALITGKEVTNHPFINDLYGDLGKVTDLKGLNKLRQRIDDTINYARKDVTPDPPKEQIAQAFRRGINDFVGNELPEAKGVSSLMSKSYDAQAFLKNAAKNPKGVGKLFGLPIIPGSVAQGAAAKAGQITAGAAPASGGLLGKILTGAKTGAKYGGALAAQEAVRIPEDIINAQGATPPVPTAPDPTQTSPDATPEQPPVDYTAKAREILNSGEDAKTQAAQLDLLGKMQAIEQAGAKSGSKAVSSATNQQIANATSGLKQISIIRGELSGDPGLANRNAGASLFGNLGRGVAGTQSFNTAKNEIVDVLARLRTGAAISKSEEAQYKSMLPTAFDSPATINQKLSTYEQLFQGILERSQAGSPALELAGATQQ